MATFWVSFATEEKFLGVAIVDMDLDEHGEFSAMDVIKETIRLRCNPGDGSVQVQKIPDSDVIPISFKNRLLRKDEAERLNEGYIIH
jgi:hypothetical protein